MSADPLEYIVDKAVCECDKGAKPWFFNSTYNTHVKIMGCMAATRVDKIPLVNIPEFGICTVTGSKCVPAPVEWLETYKLKVKGEQTLLFRCTLPCSVGGIVKFITSGQIPISPEELQALIDQNSEEQPPIEETVEEEVEVEEEVADEGGGDDGLSWWDAAEMIPFAGGVIGMVRSGSKGDWLGVGLSVLSVGLDVAGLFSFGGGNVASAAVKGGKLARVAVKGVKALNKGRKVVKVMKKVPKTVLKAAPKLLTKAGAKAVAKGLANMVDNIALKTGKICVFACFPAGTLINAEGGQIPIEQIKMGDKVWAFDEASGAIELKEVLQTTTRECDHTIELYTNQETIETTAEHPFYTNEGWKDAADLQAGDQIITRNDETVEITETKFNYEPQQVYNFEVADWHTYFVGALAWLVHNNPVAKKCVTAIITNWGAHLTRLTGEVAPALMKNPHAHHIVFKKGRGAMKKYLSDSKAILEKHGIDWYKGADNLIWAPNKNHSAKAAKAVRDALVKADKTGSKEEVVKALREMGKHFADDTIDTLY